MLVDIPKDQSRLLWRAHELLFTLNLSLVLLFAVVAGSTVGSVLQIGRWKGTINSYLGLHPHNDLGTYIGLLTWAVLLAVLAVLALHLMTDVFATFLLRWFAGITSFVAVPIAWLLVFEQSPWFPLDVNVRIWCALELCFGALAIGPLVFPPKRKPRTFALVLFLCLHCGFWVWLFAERFGIQSTLLPIVGFAASLVWVLFVNQFHRAETNDEIFA